MRRIAVTAALSLAMAERFSFCVKEGAELEDVEGLIIVASGKNCYLAYTDGLREKYSFTVDGVTTTAEGVFIIDRHYHASSNGDVRVGNVDTYGRRTVVNDGAEDFIIYDAVTTRKFSGVVGLNLAEGNTTAFLGVVRNCGRMPAYDCFNDVSTSSPITGAALKPGQLTYVRRTDVSSEATSQRVEPASFEKSLNASADESQDGLLGVCLDESLGAAGADSSVTITDGKTVYQKSYRNYNKVDGCVFLTNLPSNVKVLLNHGTDAHTFTHDVKVYPNHITMVHPKETFVTGLPAGLAGSSGLIVDALATREHLDIFSPGQKLGSKHVRASVLASVSANSPVTVVTIPSVDAVRGHDLPVFIHDKNAPSASFPTALITKGMPSDNDDQSVHPAAGWNTHFLRLKKVSAEETAKWTGEGFTALPGLEMVTLYAPIQESLERNVRDYFDTLRM